MPATPVHNTAVVDEPWDGPAQEAKLNTPLSMTVGNHEYAWRDPNADETTKAAWKLPHHQVSADGTPGAANMAACRAGMSRLGQSSTQIPEADRAACRNHLQHHMDAMNNKSMMNSEAPDMDFEALMELVEHQLSPVALVADEFVRAYMAQEFAEAQDHAAAGPAAAGRRPTRAQATDGEVAVIPLHGVITPRGSLLARIFGLGGGLEQFRADLASAVADDNVSSIVLDVDSPGGTVDMVPETAQAILAARSVKPVYSISNTMAASAGYWLASQATEMSVTPSGQVGSVGVFTIHEDVSKAAEAAGVKTTIISAGRFKTEGNPFEPLSAQAEKAMQSNVNDLYAMFVDSIAEGRGVTSTAVRAGFGEGRMVLAQKAAGIGMVDRVEELDQLLARVGGTPVNAAENEDVPAVEIEASSEVPETHAEDDGALAGRQEAVPTGRLYGEDRREQPAWLI